MRLACASSVASILLCGVASAAPSPAPTPEPIAERAAAFREAAALLDKAGAAHTRGSRNFADQLFSSAELLVGPEAVADLAPLFREGAPPRITTPLSAMPKDSAPQPAVVGSSEQDEPEPPKPKRGSLVGTLKLDGKAASGALAVITLEPASGKWHRRAPRQRVMEQRNRQFAPRLLVVPVGSTVLFPNFDNVYHNVFSRSEPRSFDLGLYKNGEARAVTLDKEGIVTLGCNLHANMSAHVVVVSAPHYVVTDADGHFNFKSLEPGKYKLRAWSDHSTTPITRDITINVDKNTVALEMSADGSDVSTDKFGVPRGKKP